MDVGRVGLLAVITGCVFPVKHLDPEGWNPPAMLSFSSAGADDNPTLTGDMLELYFIRYQDIYVATRTSLEAPWSEATVVAELSTPAKEHTCEISPDGLTLFFSSDAPGGAGKYDIWMATRPARGMAWQPAVRVPELDSPDNDNMPTPAADPSILLLASDRIVGENYDIFMSTRMGASPWSTPMPLNGVNSPSKDSGPFLSSDKLTLYFYSDRDGSDDLFKAVRTDNRADFAAPTPIADLSTPDHQEANPWVSADDKHIVFSIDNTLYEAAK